MAKKITECALLIAVAFCLSYIERLLPIQMLIPFPGFKLGLSNLVILFSLFVFDKKTAFIVLLGKSVLQTFIFGSVTGLMFSLCGGILSLLAVILSIKKLNKWFSFYGICIISAVFHNIGQIICACFYFMSIAPCSYLPILLIAAIFFGGFTGFIATILFPRLLKIKREII